MKKETKVAETPPKSSATTPEGRENELIALAYDEVELRIRNHTATSQELVHFLRLGTANARLEKEKLEAEIELQKAKARAYDTAGEIKEMYEDALRAFSGYAGEDDEDLSRDD